MKDIYKRTFRRTVKNGKIIYAGMEYEAKELLDMEGKEVEITKFGKSVGEFDISKLLVTSIPYNKNKIFWVR